MGEDQDSLYQLVEIDRFAIEESGPRYNKPPYCRGASWQ